MRLELLLYRMQVAVYAFYRRVVRRRWDYAVIREEGTLWRVTKQIPGVGIRVFGKNLLADPVDGD